MKILDVDPNIEIVPINPRAGLELTPYDFATEKTGGDHRLELSAHIAIPRICLDLRSSWQ